MYTVCKYFVYINCIHLVQCLYIKCIHSFRVHREHIGFEHFVKINRLPIDQRFKQCISTGVFKFFSEIRPQYMNEIYTTTNENNTVTRNSLKLLQLLRTKALSQKCLSYLGRFIWNGFPDDA